MSFLSQGSSGGVRGEREPVFSHVFPARCQNPSWILSLGCPGSCAGAGWTDRLFPETATAALESSQWEKKTDKARLRRVVQLAFILLFSALGFGEGVS